MLVILNIKKLLVLWGVCPAWRCVAVVPADYKLCERQRILHIFVRDFPCNILLSGKNAQTTSHIPFIIFDAEL